MLSFLLLILQLDLYALSDSSTIFNKTIQYINEGKMKVPKDMNYFIFDESDVTALNANANIMIELFQKQKEIYDKHSIPNYIFVVDSQDESTEGLTETTHNLAEYLRSRYNIKKEDTIILLVSISPGKIKIRTGDILKIRVTDSKCDTMISNIKLYLQNKNYYEAWNQFFSDINYYTKFYGNSKSDDSYKKEKIIGIIVFIILILGILSLIIIYIICKCKKRIIKSKRKKLRDFLIVHKNNNEFFNNFCVICLKRLNNTQIQITTQSDFNITQQQNNTNINN